MTTVMLLNERNKQKQKMRLTIFFINLMRNDAYQGYNNSMSKSKSEPVQNVLFDPEQTSNESIEIC